MTRRTVLTAVLAAAAWWPREAHAVPSVPSPFVIEDAVSGATFDTPTGIAFLPDGRFFVAEKRGRVYMVTNEVKSANPVWSREAEVLNEHDRGLLGIAVDPNYYANHYIYLLYTVDPDSNNVDTSPSDAFGRLARYQVGFTDSTQVVNSSRTILMGVSWRTGPLSASPSHTIGSLRFGSDGSLMVSIGDGASYTEMDAGGLDAGDFGSGPNLTNPYEDIGAFRAQSLTSLCGKILRLDPATGGGYPSNPFYDGNPSSIRSRVWAYGLRNPFRFTIRPGTGATDPTAGNPGTLYVGEVGWTDYEEMNVVPSGGLNFGWPCYEGIGAQPAYQAGTPAHNDCSSFGTADNPASQTSPKATWNHYDGSLSTPLGLVGNCSIGGAFYTGSQYPGTYVGRYFFADYGQDWFKVATVTSDNQLISIDDFGTGMDGPVDFAAHPITKDLYYVAINTGQVRRLRYTGVAGNGPPVAVANGTPTSGIAPLSVNFSSAGSFDPNNDPLLYSWSFGDASGSTDPNPTHTYTTSGLYQAILTLDDQHGGVGRDTVFVAVSGTAGTFPTTPVLDNFNRANGPLGSPWVDEVSGLSITSNALTQNGGSNSIEWAGGSFGPDQEAYVTLSAIDPFADEHDLMLKVQGQAWWLGHIEVRYDATTHHIDVATYTPGPGFQGIGSITPITLVNGDQLGARALSDGTVQVFVNGVQKGTFSVASWPYFDQGGYVGLTIADAHTSRLDDFGGGDMAVFMNTPPTATILAPVDHSFYAAGDTIWLHGSGSDAQDSSSALTYHWQMDIHHNTHIHPASFVSDLKDDYLIGENHDDGTGVFEEIMLMVTDTGNLIDTASVRIYPEIDVHPGTPAVSPELIVAGATGWFDFWFHNGGRMPTPITHWQVLVDGSVAAQGDTLVAPGDSVWITRRLQTNLSVGTHQIRAVVDSLNQWVETSETNNGATASFDVVTPPTGVETIPVVLALSEAKPNPSYRTSRFTLSLPKESSVQLSIYDLQGREVWQAPARRYTPGTWQLEWTGGPAPTPAGVYLARVRVDEATFIRRIARVR